MKVFSALLLCCLASAARAFVVPPLRTLSSSVSSYKKLRISSSVFAENKVNGEDSNVIVAGEDKPAATKTPSLPQQQTRQDFFPEMWMEEQTLDNANDLQRRNTLINIITGGLLAAMGAASWKLYQTEVYTPPDFVRLATTQFIAALGDPQANSGTNAQTWGLWRQDPGPRGVFLQQYERDLLNREYVAPVGGWKFNPNDWWIEEHGLIMESPEFPLPPGRYLVTGGRQVTTGLTVQADGEWKLDDNAVLGDVTHLPCRSARYQPLPGSSQVLQPSPANANPKDFPVKPGAIMPSIPGTQKQDYAVLFLIGKATHQ